MMFKRLLFSLALLCCTWGSAFAQNANQVPSLATFRANAYGGTVWLAGYVTPGDGGQGYFLPNGKQSVTHCVDNGTTVIVDKNGTCWDRQSWGGVPVSTPSMITVPTIAALENIGVRAGIDVTAAYVPGIGIYQWNATSTATPDPSDTPQTIVQVTGVTTGRMVLQNGAVGNVANIAALEALPDAPIGMTVNVGGTQGGSFTVVSGTFSASDGGAVFGVSNSAGGTYTDRYWLRQITAPAIYPITWFGCVGDNSSITPNNSCLTSVIDLVNSYSVAGQYGAEIYCPTGIYKVSVQLPEVTAANVSLVGPATGSNPIYPACRVSSTVTGANSYILGFGFNAANSLVKNVMLEGAGNGSTSVCLREGDYTTQTGSEEILNPETDHVELDGCTTGLYLSGAQEFRIHNTNFGNVATVGYDIFAADGTLDGQIYNNQFFNWGTQAITFQYKSPGVVTEANPNGDNRIYNNIFQGIDKSGTPSVQMTQCVHCYFYKNWGEGITVDWDYTTNGFGADGLYDETIKDNNLSSGTLTINVPDVVSNGEIQLPFTISGNRFAKINLTATPMLSMPNAWTQSQNITIGGGGTWADAGSDASLLYSLPQTGESNLVSNYNFASSSLTGWTEFHTGSSPAYAVNPFPSSNETYNFCGGSGYALTAYDGASSGWTGGAVTTTVTANTNYTATFVFDQAQANAGEFDVGVASAISASAYPTVIPGAKAGWYDSQADANYGGYALAVVWFNSGSNTTVYPYFANDTNATLALACVHVVPGFWPSFTALK